LVASCAAEVDADQARMFGRRFRAVDQTLADLAPGEARVLRVGLRQRLEEILAGPGPRALRVRALADFYGSHAGVLAWRGRGGELAALLDPVPWRPVAPGVRHARLDGDATSSEALELVPYRGDNALILAGELPQRGEVIQDAL